MTRATPDDSNKSFHAEDLVCIRGERLVFSGLSFEVGAGTATLLRGPNGAGKSSLLRLVAGLLRPAAGQLRWGSESVDRDREAHRRKVRYVGHLDAIKPVLSVGENLAAWAGIYGGRAADAPVASALDTMGLSGLADLPARFLSAGQRRRLNLARLLLDPGTLWLLDEPTVSLDSDSVNRLEQAIKHHLAAGGSALIATHTDLHLENAAVLALAPARPAIDADA